MRHARIVELTSCNRVVYSYGRIIETVLLTKNYLKRIVTSGPPCTLYPRYIGRVGSRVAHGSGFSDPTRPAGPVSGPDPTREFELSDPTRPDPRATRGSTTLEIFLLFVTLVQVGLGYVVMYPLFEYTLFFTVYVGMPIRV